MTNRRHLDRELLLVRVATKNHLARAEIVDLAALFMARVVAVQEDSVTVQMAGNQETVADFLRLLKPYVIIDLSRTGTIAVGREAAEPSQEKA